MINLSVPRCLGFSVSRSLALPHISLSPSLNSRLSVSWSLDLFWSFGLKVSRSLCLSVPESLSLFLSRSRDLCFLSLFWSPDLSVFRFLGFSISQCLGFSLSLSLFPCLSVSSVSRFLGLSRIQSPPLGVSVSRSLRVSVCRSESLDFRSLSLGFSVLRIFSFSSCLGLSLSSFFGLSVFTLLDVLIYLGGFISVA